MRKEKVVFGVCQQDSEQIHEEPTPAIMVEALARRGVLVGNPAVKPCPRCGWRHVKPGVHGPVCTWCGRERA